MINHSYECSHMNIHIHVQSLRLIPHLIMRLAKLFTTFTNLSYSIPNVLPPRRGWVYSEIVVHGLINVSKHDITHVNHAF